MSAVLDAVVARLQAQVIGRQVYAREAPSGPLPTEYLLVREALIDESSARSTATIHVGARTVTVLSVARDDEPLQAHRVAQVGAERARAALRNWRPLGAWVLWPSGGSVGAYRDDTLPDPTLHVAVQYAVRSAL